LPARAESLQVTERYRSGMIRLRKQGQREAGRLWGQVKADDLDGTFPLGQLELTVTTLQREAARLSSAYLSTFIASELGEPESPPAVSVWDKTFGGNPLREGLRSAVIKAKQRIDEGMDSLEATKASRATLISDVGLFIDTAARESLRQGMEMDERIEGYQRAVKGTCGACAGDVAVETSVELPSIPLKIHPNCQCVTEPVVRGRSPRTLPDHTKNWSPQDFAAIERYVRSPDSYTINSRLRGVTPDPRSLSGQQVARSKLTEAEINSAVKQLDELIERAGPLGTKIRATRVAGVRLKDSGLSRRKLPYTVTDKGFGSTAALREEVQGVVKGAGVRYDLDIDPRVKAIWGSNPRERELLLQRGVRYVIRSIEKKDKYSYVVRADVLPPE
jgi:hypothetical protein